MGTTADAIVVTGALKNPGHFKNKDQDHHQILGRFNTHSHHTEVMAAIEEVCGHRPAPGQEHYAAVKCGVRLYDPWWKNELGDALHVGSRIGAFAAAALGMADAFIAEPDFPGFTLNGGSWENLHQVMKAFGLDYEARPEKFIHHGVDVYTAGDINENSKLYKWLIENGLVESQADIFEGDTYIKHLWWEQGKINYQKEAMGASINPFQIPWFQLFLNPEKVAKDVNYPYWFVSNQALSRMDRVNESPFYLFIP